MYHIANISPLISSLSTAENSFPTNNIKEHTVATKDIVRYAIFFLFVWGGQSIVATV